MESLEGKERFRVDGRPFEVTDFHFRVKLFDSPIKARPKDDHGSAAGTGLNAAIVIKRVAVLATSFLLVSCLAYSSTLKMEAMCSSET
jgi:hypothetical protein